MEHLLCCSKCSEVILKGLGSSAKIRGKLIVVKEGKVFSICKGCGEEVLVPLTMDTGVITKNPALFINKAVDSSKKYK